ncbi:hypothetical protein HanIR_Chr10g0464721 [Helianthus annuus]|nr:hypothetical protein HanIR_Chr10g0464721 [Helianthus annuus]
MKEEVITPVELSPFLHPEAATVSFVGAGRVCILLLHLQRKMEKLPPHPPCGRHQIMAHTMVDELEEAPFAAGFGDEIHGGFA